MFPILRIFHNLLMDLPSQATSRIVEAKWVPPSFGRVLTPRGVTMVTHPARISITWQAFGPPRVKDPLLACENRMKSHWTDYFHLQLSFWNNWFNTQQTIVHNYNTISTMMQLLISFFLKLHKCIHKVLLQLDVILALHARNVLMYGYNHYKAWSCCNLWSDYI